MAGEGDEVRTGVEELAKGWGVLGGLWRWDWLRLFFFLLRRIRGGNDYDDVEGDDGDGFVLIGACARGRCSSSTVRGEIVVGVFRSVGPCTSAAAFPCV